MGLLKKGNAAPETAEKPSGFWSKVVTALTIPAAPTRGIVKFQGCFKTRPIVK